MNKLVTLQSLPQGRREVRIEGGSEGGQDCGRISIRFPLFLKSSPLSSPHLLLKKVQVNQGEEERKCGIKCACI
jgi:hypothetical protein